MREGNAEVFRTVPPFLPQERNIGSLVVILNNGSAILQCALAHLAVTFLDVMFSRLLRSVPPVPSYVPAIRLCRILRCDGCAAAAPKRVEKRTSRTRGMRWQLSSLHYRSEKIPRRFYGNEALFWSACGPCSMSWPLLLPPSRLHHVFRESPRSGFRACPPLRLCPVDGSFRPECY